MSLVNASDISTSFLIVQDRLTGRSRKSVAPFIPFSRPVLTSLTTPSFRSQPPPPPSKNTLHHDDHYGNSPSIHHGALLHRRRGPRHKRNLPQPRAPTDRSIHPKQRQRCIIRPDTIISWRSCGEPGNSTYKDGAAAESQWPSCFTERKYPPRA